MCLKMALIRDGGTLKISLIVVSFSFFAVV